MNENIAIRINGLWKRYGLPFGYTLHRYITRLKQGHIFSQPKPNNDVPWALKSIELEIHKGECVGIIGQNGAGKSTLLKVLAGVTPPSRGSVKVQGRIFPMIELNAGISTELTGRENIYLLGAIMGISRQKMKAKVEEIEDFCELGQWLEQPVWKYSSGMLTRLGFAVAVNVDANILLIDEVMAVGDIAFRRKCFNQLEKIHSSGNTVVLVSHSIRQIERLCDKVLLLDAGEQIAWGKPIDVISQYYTSASTKLIQQQLANGETVQILQTSPENCVVDILNVRTFNYSGQATVTFQTGDDLTIEVEYHAHQTVERVIIGIGIMTVDSFHVASFTNEGEQVKMSLRKQGIFRFTIKTLPLLTGIYTINLKVMHSNGGILGGGRGFAIFNVSVPEHLRISSGGLVTMNTLWEKPSIEKV